MFVLETFELDRALGLASGAWGAGGDPGPPRHGGRFVLALRRERAEWKIALDINESAR